LHRFCKPLSSEFFDVGGTAVLERLSRLRRVAKKTQRHSQPSAHGGSPWTWIQYSPIEPGQQGGNTAQQPKNTKVSCADFGQVARNLLAFHTLDESRCFFAFPSDESHRSFGFPTNFPGGDIVNPSPQQAKSLQQLTGGPASWDRTVSKEKEAFLCDFVDGLRQSAAPPTRSHRATAWRQCRTESNRSRAAHRDTNDAVRISTGDD